MIPKIGTFLLVVAWGETERSVLAEALRLMPLVTERIAGAVLNKVDIRTLQQMARDPRDAFYLAGPGRSWPTAA
jgi:succinoglycan biosynthesis transport protein ExoP